MYVSQNFNCKEIYYFLGADEIERVDETAVRPGDEKAKKTSSVGFRDIKQALKSLPKSLMSLVKNVTFMLLIMHGVCAYLVISGLATFLPKYFESQFGLSSSDSAFMVGKSVDCSIELEQLFHLLPLVE